MANWPGKMSLVVLILATSILGVWATPTFGKPSTSTVPGVTVSNPMLLESPVRHVDWVGGDKQTLLMLTDKHQLYRSIDGGQEWVNQAQKLESNRGVESFIVSQADPSVIFLIGADKENWVTRDMGKTYEPVPGMKILEVQLHPTNPGWILASSMSATCGSTRDHTVSVSANLKRKTIKSAESGAAVASDESGCNKELHVSKDYGKTWRLIASYIVQFSWAPKGQSEDAIFACLHREKRGKQQFGIWNSNIDFVSTPDYFNTVNTIVKYGNRMLFTRYFVFVATVNPLSPTEVFLMVNRDNVTSTTFQKAKLPIELTQKSYTILDSSEGVVFLHVNHLGDDAVMGMVYISDSSGSSYSLSLPNNRRGLDGKCDFEKVEGLEGIYLANFVEEVAVIAPDESFKESTAGAASNNRHTRAHRVKSVITFDKGGEWNFLKAPEKDSTGAPIHCNEGDCNLHLFGINAKYGPFYSAAHALGLILGTGNVGSHLIDSPDAVNTYLSRDAGLTWHEIAKGSHIYEFGNHGGLIVMANDRTPTDTVMFSTDEGLSWTTLKISDRPFVVENIVIESFTSSHSFMVVGYSADAGVAVQVDFKNVHDRTCKGVEAAGTAMSDYELWTPSDGRTKNCLLGHTVTYTRRKRDRKCYNPENHSALLSYEHCACTSSDFECDYGFRRESTATGENGVCVPDTLSPDVAVSKPDQCDGYYLKTRGYRRIAGDTCVGGSEFLPVMTPCSGQYQHSSHVGTVLLVLLALLVVCLCGVTAVNRFDLLKIWFSGVREKFPNVMYGRLPQGQDKHEGPDSMIDNELDGDDDHEIREEQTLVRAAKPTRTLSSLPAPPKQDVKIPVLAPPPSAGGLQLAAVGSSLDSSWDDLQR